MFRVRTPEHAAAAIRDMARLLGVKNRELAARSGFTETQISAWFHGRRRINPDSYIILANALDCDVAIVPRPAPLTDPEPIPFVAPE